MNIMQNPEIERVILSCGGVGDKLEKSVKLLEVLSDKRKIMKTKSNKRIPSLGVRPGLELGCMVTLRGQAARSLLKRLLAAVNNTISNGKIKENHFSFGIKEYIEIPGVEFIRDVGIQGLNVTVVFSRKGKRVAIRKIKQAKVPKKQYVSAEEIIDYMKKNFNMEIKGEKER